MKITRTAAFVFLLSFLSIHRIFLLFSLPFSVSELVSSVSKSSNFVLLIVVNAIVLAVRLLGSLKPSSDEDFDSFSDHSSLVGGVDYEAEKPKFKEDGIEIDEFVPRLVYVEYYKGEKTSEHERERVLLLEYFGDGDDISDGFHGYDGYEEDNDGGSSSINEDLSSEGEDDENLEKRIEEFIAKTNKQWREELLNDKLLLTAP